MCDGLAAGAGEIPCPGGRAVARPEAFLLPDRIKREKGVRWMPWRQEAMKDVVRCDKPGGAANRL